MSTAMRELRTPVMILVEVSWEDPDGKFRSVSARMEDKSVGGACIRLKKPVEVGTWLRIQWRFEQFSGVVKYCRREEWDYIVGIQRDPANSVPTGPAARTDEILKTAEKSTELPVVTFGARTNVQSEVRTNVRGMGQAPEKTVTEVPTVSPVETEPVLPMAGRVAVEFPRGIQRESGREIGPERVNRDRLGRSRAEELRTIRRTGLRTTPRTVPRAKGREIPKEVPKEKKSMTRKWLELSPWHSKQEGIAEVVNGGGVPNGEAKTERPVTPPTPPPRKYVEPAKESASSFEAELLPMEDIYRAAGIMNPRRGYSINKVVEMLRSPHIVGLSKEMKRAALLMALDAASISLDQLQVDAKARQEALDSYEAQQKKQIEAEWARKAEENVQIEADLVRVKAHYMARIRRNLDGVAREKSAFDTWLATKKQESESMAEAVELCVKPVVEEPAAPPVANAAAAGSGAGSVAAPGPTKV
jgi:hypothetical protein